jgi:hypothetical protein
MENEYIGITEIIITDRVFSFIGWLAVIGCDDTNMLLCGQTVNKKDKFLL